MTIFASSGGSDDFNPTMRLHAQTSAPTPHQAGATVTHPASPSPSNPAPGRATPAPVAGQIRPLSLAPTAPITSTIRLAPADASGGGDGSGGGDDSGGGNNSGGGEGGGQPPTPNITFSGGSVDQDGSMFGVVGGKVSITVYTANDDIIDSVEYSIEGAVESQSWTVSAGSSTRLPGSVTHPADPSTETLQSAEDSLRFYWDETTGTHHVTVAVTYPEGTTTLNYAVSVGNPDVSLLKMTSNPLQFGQFSIGANQVLGFFQTSPGVYFNATVTTHKFGGDFAFLQEISIDLMQKYTFTPDITESSPTVLDWNGLDETNPLAIMLADITYSLYPNDTGTLPYRSGPFENPPVDQVQDTPRLAFAGFGNVLNQPIMFREDATFTTRLVFRSDVDGDQGAWISLGYMIWTLHGERTYDSIKGVDRTDPANWTGAESLTPPSDAAGTKEIATQLLPD